MQDLKNTISRRSLIFRGGAFAAALGMPIPYHRHLADGVIPIALAQNTLDIPGKQGLTVLSDRPLNAETPAHFLDDDVTPARHMFIRNNGVPPDVSAVTDDSWMLTIDGEVETPKAFSITDLKRQFEHITLQLQMECGGNGRRYFSPGASGNQWSFGAIACPEWTGVRLIDVLNSCGLKSTAYYTGHYGADAHLSGDPNRVPISRGLPIEKALDPHTMIAWAMNGEDIPVQNGHPLRLIAPGWPGSCSQKWLNRITIRDVEHDGPKMGGQSYRVPAYSVAPGTEVADEDMEIIESMPVKSLITYPQTGVRTEPGQSQLVRGHAWAGERGVSLLEVSIDFGATWQRATLAAPVNKYAWQHWRAEVQFPQAGYYEVWARATDEIGVAQPATTPGWNPRGYLNNMQHRIAVFAV
ncbi:MAG: sulfite oxidase [Pseudomonadota bacterium]